jgi:electron transport complex protein RnfD
MASQEIARKLLTVSSAPLWHSGRTVQKTMIFTLVALLPAAIMAVFRYGYGAIEVIAWAGLSAVAAEFFVQRYLTKRPATADNFSALVDGVIFAFLLPSTAPVWLVVIGSFITIILGRMVFGGYGGSPVCAPALGWCVLTISWPHYMDLNAMLLQWDLIEPLSELKYFGLDATASVDLQSLLLGNYLGALGASQGLMILLGGVFLLAMKQLRWFIPVSFLLGVTLAGMLYNLIDPAVYAPVQFHLFCGSTMLAAFFLMPYPSASPSRLIPMLIYGFFGGVLVVIIRTYGIYPDGAMFAVLLANLCTPLFDMIAPKPFGGR